MKSVTTGADFDEMGGSYPDDHMNDDIGDTLAHALWARHIRGLHLLNHEVLPVAQDPRPAFRFVDAAYMKA